MHLKTIFQLTKNSINSNKYFQIFKINQSGGFLGSLLSKIAGSLMKVAVPLTNDFLAPLGITAADSAIEAGI